MDCNQIQQFPTKKIHIFGTAAIQGLRFLCFRLAHLKHSSSRLALESRWFDRKQVWGKHLSVFLLILYFLFAARLTTIMRREYIRIIYCRGFRFFVSWASIETDLSLS